MSVQLIAEGSSKLASVRTMSLSIDPQRLIKSSRFLPEEGEEALLLPPLLLVVRLLLLKRRRRRKLKRRFVTLSIIFPWVN